MTPAEIELGQRAPAFELRSLSGRRYSRDDMLGNPTHLLLLRHLG